MNVEKIINEWFENNGYFIGFDIREIVKEWLDGNGYEGLVGFDCGCELKDLMPCGEYCGDCVPGYKVPCLGGDDCPANGDCDWHISTEKP